MNLPVTTLLADGRVVDHPTARDRGIGRYTTGLFQGLVEIGAPVVGLYGTDEEAELLETTVPGMEIHRWTPQVVRAHLEPGAWYLATQLMLHPIPLDPVPSVVTQARLPVAAVMHDVIPYRYPEQYLRDPNARFQAALRAALTRTLDVLVANSSFSADTAAEELRFPRDRIRVIGAGVEPQFVPPEVAPAPAPDRVVPSDVTDYVVAVTGADDRKNTLGLIRAWGLVPESLRRRHPLVVATAVDAATLTRWRDAAVEAGVEREVVFTGHVTDSEMVAILQRARLAVMPSFEEGYGLPVLEALACGTPAICSDVSSLPEVVDDPAAWFDPASDDAIAGAIERALVDDGHRANLAAAGERALERFTWTRAATETVRALEELGPRWERTPAPPPRRVALAGPFRGSRSGIGPYDESVAAAITTTPGAPTLDLLVDGSATSEPTGYERTDGRPRLPVRALGRYTKPWDYDHIVAVLGSSEHHVATSQLALEVPCHVWLHESSLVGVHVGLGHVSGSEGWAIEHVAAMVGQSDRARVAGLSGTDLLDAPRLDQLGVTLLDTTLARARSVIVSSDRAADVVRSVRSDGPPLLVLPLAFPPAEPPPGVPSAPTIVAVGWLAANKAPLVAIEVLSRLPEATRLSFVGPSDPAMADRVRAAAETAGLADRVEVTGRVDDDEYRRRLAGARIGLQLRTGDRGEMSAALTDLAAHGIPTVTTLATAGPSDAGISVVELAVDPIVALVEPLLVDDDRWRAGSAAALDRAGSWTFDDVAAELLAWLEEVDELPAGTIRRARETPGPSRR